MIKVGSDFSGVGAFDQVLKRLNIEYKTVFACDMDKYARQTFIHNYGEPNYYPENVYDRDIPKESLDIYMTSPPCQAFSLAGRRKGEDDKRGILFYNSHEFIKENKPRYFIFENVKGLLSDDNGNTFAKWVQYLGGKSVNGNTTIFPHNDSVPYHIYWKVLNAKNYGIPQNRERVFIIGIRDDQDNNFKWPKEKFLDKRLRDVLEKHVDEKYFLSDKMAAGLIIKGNKEYINQDTQASQVYSPDGLGQTLCAGTHGYANGYIKVNVVANLPGNHEQNSRVYGINGLSPTLTTMQGGGQEPKIHIDYRIRKLTPRECFRLMDFPDSFTWPVSDSQAYKQAGNSICVGVLAGIIEKFKIN